MEKHVDREQAPHVVVIGGGFGGLTAARELRRAPVSVTVVDRENHHLFQPLLYQVATAGLSPADIASPIRAILRKQSNATVLLAEAREVDLAGRRVILDAGELRYDFLVIAAGSTTNYFGNTEWEHWAPGMKSLNDAIEVRRRVLLAFEKAERERHPVRKRELLSFAVIGGGPTGVELAGAISELARRALARDFRVVNPASAKIHLLEAGPRILPMFDEPLATRALEQLVGLGVTVLTGAKVVGVDAHGVALDGGGQVAAATTIWTAGVHSTSLIETLGLPLERGRLRVNADLSVPGYDEVFVIGDLASFIQDGAELPGLAAVAKQEGRAAADAIERTVRGQERRPFRYRDKGIMATVGRSRAIAQLGKLRLSGFIAWLAWLLVHIVMLIGFRNRVVVLFTWAWSYITYKRGSRLITGLERPPVPVRA